MHVNVQNCPEIRLDPKENPPGHNDSRTCAALTVIINSLPQCAQCSAQVLSKTNPLVMKIPVLKLENIQVHYSCCTSYPHQLKLNSKEMDVWLGQKYLQNLSHSPWTQDADIYLQVPETCFGWFTAHYNQCMSVHISFTCFTAKIFCIRQVSLSAKKLVFLLPSTACWS